MHFFKNLAGNSQCTHFSYNFKKSSKINGNLMSIIDLDNNGILTMKNMLVESLTFY